MIAKAVGACDVSSSVVPSAFLSSLNKYRRQCFDTPMWVLQLHLRNFQILVIFTSLSSQQWLTVVCRFNMSNTQASDRPRRRNIPESLPRPQEPSRTREIDAGPLLEKHKPKLHADGHLTPTKAVGIAGAMLHSNLPALLSWGAIAALIFGGCCSNVGVPAHVLIWYEVANATYFRSSPWKQ